jgi:hypothetical protein
MGGTDFRAAPLSSQATEAVAPKHTATVHRVVAVLERKGVRFTETGVELVKRPR